MAKYDGMGNNLQYIKYKSSSSISGIQLKSMSFDSGNNLILCANTTYGDIVHIDTCSVGWWQGPWPSGNIHFNAKINAEGKISWFKEYPSSFTPNKTIIDADDNIITVGYSIIKYSKNGNILWSKHVESNYANDIINISVNKKKELTFLLNLSRDTIGKYDNITFQAGGVHDPYGSSKFIFKIDENGKLIWYKPLNQWSVSDKLDIVNSNFNNLLGLNFENTLQYDSLNFNSSIGNNGCIIKIDSIGNPIWSKQFGSGLYYNAFRKVLVDRLENAFVLESYYTPIQIDNFNLPSKNGRFLCKLLNDSLLYTHSNNIAINNQFDIYPNPTNSIIIIKSDGLLNEACLTLCNINGQILQKKRITSNILTMDIGNLIDGIYILRLENNNQIIIRKIVKN